MLASICAFLMVAPVFNFQSLSSDANGFLLLNSAHATDLWGEQTGMDQVGEKFGETGGDPTDVRDIIVELIKIFLTFLGIIFVILILVAGFKWMTAAGNEDQIKEAKEQLSRAIVGLIIILSAYAITYFIFDVLIKATTGEVWGL